MRLFFLACLLLAALPGWANGPDVPVDYSQVPSKLEFGGITIKLDDEYRALIQQDVDKLMANERFFRASVERADAYFPIVERVLAEEGLPTDFKYLVLQESKLVSDVVSTSNAVGFWQFKKETAVEMGLRVDDDVDERMNILAATRAAARYLKRNNGFMQNWVYALLSYYAGLTGAKGIVDPQYIGQTKMELGLNTHWYITKFLAHKVAYEQNLNRNPNSPLRIVEYAECENKTLEQIAAETQVPLEDLAFYNKWARKGTIPADKDYTVVMPYKVAATPGLLALTNQPAADPKADLKPYRKTYFLGLIKSKEPVTTPPPAEAAVIATAAPSPATAGKAGTPAPAVNTATEAYHSEVPLLFTWNGIKAIMARRGDNTSKLALQAGISRDDFLDHNDMRVFDLIVPGQVYYIKPKRRKARVPYHVVQDNETLWEISQQYGITMKQLLRKNGLTKPELLKRGRVVWLRHTKDENQPVEYVKLPDQPKPLQSIEPIVGPKPTPKLTPKQDSARQERLQRMRDSLDKTEPTLVGVDDDSTDNKGNEQIFIGQNVPDTSTWTYLTLQPGQTLYGLSSTYDVPIDSLHQWNGLDQRALAIGMQLRLRKPKPVAPATAVAKADSSQPAPVSDPGGVTSGGIAKANPKTAPKTEAPKPEAPKKPKAEPAPAKPATPKTEASPKTENTPKDATPAVSPKTETTPKAETSPKPTPPAKPVVKMEATDVPAPKTTAKPDAPETEAPKVEAPASDVSEHIVKPGETLYRLSKMYSVTVDKLLEWNPAAQAGLKEGQKLRVK